MMAGLIQAPQEYSPFVNMKLAKHQQEVVLSRTQQLMDYAEAAAAREEKSNLAGLNRFRQCSPYVTNAASQELMKRFIAMP